MVEVNLCPVAFCLWEWKWVRPRAGTRWWVWMRCKSRTSTWSGGFGRVQLSCLIKSKQVGWRSSFQKTLSREGSKGKNSGKSAGGGALQRKVAKIFKNRDASNAVLNPLHPSIFTLVCILDHCCVCLCVWGAGWTSPAGYAEVLFPGGPFLCLPAFLLKVGSACPLWWLFYRTRALRSPWGCVADPEKENGGRPAPRGQGGRSHKRAVFLGGILSALSPSSEERPELCLQVEDYSES